MSLSTKQKQLLKRGQYQCGVAIITALLLTSLAITIVASLFWQQQIQVRAVENQRLQMQKQWILRGALDWAKLILREDVKYSSVDDLSEPWAVPLSDTPLDQYVQKDDDRDEVHQAMLSGYIQDAQSRLNLTGLATAGQINENEVQFFEHLLSNLKIETALARKAAIQIAASQQNEADGVSAIRYLGFTQVTDLLSVPGFSPEVLAEIADYVIFLPRITAINANTASSQVLSAVLPALSLADAQALVAKRARTIFHNQNEFAAQMSGTQTAIDARTIAVTTNFFLVNGRISLRNNGLQIQALVQRNGLNTEVLWIREI